MKKYPETYITVQEAFKIAADRRMRRLPGKVQSLVLDQAFRNLCDAGHNPRRGVTYVAVLAVLDTIVTFKHRTPTNSRTKHRVLRRNIRMKRKPTRKKLDIERW